MKTSFRESTRIEIAKPKNQSLPEVLSYAGSLIALGAIGLGFYANWDELTKSQKTATFSIFAIAFFVGGLLASDTADLRRRLSGYLYFLSAASSGVAVYVTYDEKPAPLQSFALATVISLLGYTVAATLIGHAGLFLATSGTLVALGFEFVESENLRLYTQASLVIAFAMSWLILSAFTTVKTDLGYALATGAIFAVSQYAFIRNYESLSYAISLGLLVISAWLYLRIPSCALVISAIAAFSVGLTEWVMRTMDNSIAAIIGMTVVGAAITLVSIVMANSQRND